MPSIARSSRRRLLMTLLPGLFLLAIGGGSAWAGSEPSASPTVVGSSDGATPTVPNPNVTGAQPVPFDRIEVGPDGRTLTIYYWHGVEGCYGLKQVTVTAVQGGYAVTIWAGMLPEAVNRLCIDAAQYYSTQVILDVPVFVDGGLD